MVPASKFFC